MRGDDSAVGGSLARAFFCALSGSGGDSAMRTVQYIPETGIVRLIDQTRLPAALEFVDCRTWQEVASAIRSMRVRGAPALGVSAAYGLALAALRFEGDDPTEFEAEIGRLPTDAGRYVRLALRKGERAQAAFAAWCQEVIDELEEAQERERR